jgi:hypothetical protein
LALTVVVVVVVVAAAVGWFLSHCSVTRIIFPFFHIISSGILLNFRNFPMSHNIFICKCVCLCVCTAREFNKQGLFGIHVQRLAIFAEQVSSMAFSIFIFKQRVVSLLIECREIKNNNNIALKRK